MVDFVELDQKVCENRLRSEFNLAKEVDVMVILGRGHPDEPQRSIVSFRWSDMTLTFHVRAQDIEGVLSAMRVRRARRMLDWLDGAHVPG